MPHESTVDHEAKITDERFRRIVSAWMSKVSDPAAAAADDDSSEKFVSFENFLNH